MSEPREDAVPTRESYWGRWEIIRQCRIPKSCLKISVNKEGGAVTVGAAAVKAVLLDLAQHDKPGNEIYKGLENVAHATGLSIRVINNAIKALENAGIMERRHRSMGKSKYSILSWDRIESLREKFWTIEKKDSNPHGDDDQDVAAEDLSLHPLVDQILSIDVVRAKIPPEKASKIVEALTKAYGEEAVLHAVESLDKVAAASIYKANSPEAYLRTVLANAAKSASERGDAKAKISSFPPVRTKTIEAPHEVEEDEEDEAYSEEEEDAAAEAHYLNDDADDPYHDPYEDGF
jgi:DNA-binding transcriptional ArsR family regulator